MRADGAPLDPNGATAHDWLSRELAKPVYADQRSLVQRLWDWAIERLNDLLSGVGGALPIYVLIPLLLLVAGVVAFGLSRLRSRSLAPRPSEDEGVLGDTELTAAELRRRAARYAAQGAHSAAFLDYFRAITRRAEERALLPPQPGRTAHEVSDELTPYFPVRQDDLRSAAAFFDRVRYGGALAAASDVDAISTLDHDLDRARPQHRVTA